MQICFKVCICTENNTKVLYSRVGVHSVMPMGARGLAPAKASKKVGRARWGLCLAGLLIGCVGLWWWLPSHHRTITA